MNRILFSLLILVLSASKAPLLGQDAISLIDRSNPAAGWKFNNGQEFPGATGSLTADSEAQRAGRASLKLSADFTKGGKYVEAGRIFDEVDIRELSMWVRSPDGDRFTLRLNDSSGQTHQIAIKMAASPNWQNVVLPLEHFFSKRGEADAVTNIAKYESWAERKMGNGTDRPRRFTFCSVSRRNRRFAPFG